MSPISIPAALHTAFRDTKLGHQALLTLNKGTVSCPWTLRAQQEDLIEMHTQLKKSFQLAKFIKNTVSLIILLVSLINMWLKKTPTYLIEIVITEILFSHCWYFTSLYIASLQPAAGYLMHWTCNFDSKAHLILPKQSGFGSYKIIHRK